MARRAIILAMVFLIPGLLAADEKPKKKSFFGVQIARGKEDSIIIVLMAFDDSPAQKAGLKSGDIIVSINGVKPANLESAVKLIRNLEPNKAAKVKVMRGGVEKSISVIPAAM